MDLINDYICHCPLGKQRALATCLQKYHAINFSAHASLGIRERCFSSYDYMQTGLLSFGHFSMLYCRQTSKDGKCENCPLKL